MIGEEAALDAIDAELEAIAVGCRGDRVGAGLGLAIGVGRDCGDELAGRIGEVGDLGNFELEVVALGDFREAGFLGEDCGLGFAGQWVLAEKRDFSSLFSL